MPESNSGGLPAWAEIFAPTFQRVAHQLEHAEGFLLLPVELPDEITASLLARWLTARGQRCDLVKLKVATTDRSLLEQILGTSDDAVATIACSPGGQLPSPALQLLNQQRDLLVARHPRPLVWCGPERLLDLTWKRAPDLWSIAAVPVRLPELRVDATAGPRASLVLLLIELFSAVELHQFVSVYFNTEGAAGLPWQASLAELSVALVNLFAEQGLITPEFFAALRRVRPRRAREIELVAHHFLGRSTPSPARGIATRSTIIDWLTDPRIRRRALAWTTWEDEHRAREHLDRITTAVHATHQIHKIMLLTALENSQVDRTEPTTSVEEIMRGVSSSRPMLVMFLNSDGGPLSQLDRDQRDGIVRLLDRIASVHHGVIRFLLPVADLMGIDAIVSACRDRRIDFFSFYLDPV